MNTNYDSPAVQSHAKRGSRGSSVGQATPDLHSKSDGLRDGETVDVEVSE